MGSTALLADNEHYANANIVWTAPNAEDVTVIVPASGTSTDSLKHLNKGSDGTGYNIIADADIVIKEINYGGTAKLIGDPIQVAANSRRVRALKHPVFTSMVIGILSPNTTVQLEVF